MTYSPRFSFKGWSFSELVGQNKAQIRTLITAGAATLAQIEWGNPLVSIAVGAVVFFVQETADFYLSDV